jgi:hypothetical protein
LRTAGQARGECFNWRNTAIKTRAAYETAEQLGRR